MITFAFLLCLIIFFSIIFIEGCDVVKPYKDIIDFFGYRTQMKKLNEECFEFLEAVDNYEDVLLFLKNAPDKDKEVARSFVVEEMGDVLILLTEFIAKYDIKKEELDATMDMKLARTLERMKVGYYDKDRDTTDFKAC
jgi:NTP pyrophosphatase (non-canonical NTP hydrolase)